MRSLPSPALTPCADERSGSRDGPPVPTDARCARAAAVVGWTCPEPPRQGATTAFRGGVKRLTSKQFGTIGFCILVRCTSSSWNFSADAARLAPAGVCRSDEPPCTCMIGAPLTAAAPRSVVFLCAEDQWPQQTLPRKTRQAGSFTNVGWFSRCGRSLNEPGAPPSQVPDELTAADHGNRRLAASCSRPSLGILDRS